MDIKESELKDLIAGILKISAEDINDLSSPDSIDSWDSHAHLNLVLALESKFNISFDDDEVLELLSYKSIKKSLMTQNINFI